MGSSNMRVVTTGDVEDQRHKPSWFVNHKHMLRPNQEGEANNLGFVILKLPEYLRQPPIAFSPLGWQFGLHNRENLDSSESEAIKLGLAVQYGLVGEKWDHFCDTIVDDPKAMLACYGLQNGMTSWTEEQLKHVLALDALFLADYIDTEFPRNERRLWRLNMMPSLFEENNVFYARYDTWVQSVPGDLFRVENQIPFVLIDKVVVYITSFIASQTSKGKEPLIVDLQYQQRSVEYGVKSLVESFMSTSNEAFKLDNSSLLGEKTHILAAAYKVICGFEGLLKKSGQEGAYVHVPSATKLNQSDIKIVGIDGPLCKMEYKNKCLCLPKMRMYNQTICFVRNMAWYEVYNIPDGCLFNDYISLMVDLIQAHEDLDLLIKRGVIRMLVESGDLKCGELWMKV